MMRIFCQQFFSVWIRNCGGHLASRTQPLSLISAIDISGTSPPLFIQVLFSLPILYVAIRHYVPLASHRIALLVFLPSVLTRYLLYPPLPSTLVLHFLLLVQASSSAHSRTRNPPHPVPSPCYPARFLIPTAVLLEIHISLLITQDRLQMLEILYQS